MSFVNVLPREKQIEVIAALCEGVGIRTAARLTGVNRGTVGSLALRVGLGCMELHDRLMVGIRTERLAKLGPQRARRPQKLPSGDLLRPAPSLASSGGLRECDTDCNERNTARPLQCGCLASWKSHSSTERLTGKLFNPLPDPGFVPLSTIVAVQFVPLLAICAVIATFTWRRTGSSLPGALICGLFVTWYVVAGTATQAAF